MKHILAFLSFLLFALTYTQAQKDTLLVKISVQDGDTLPVLDLKEATIYAPYAAASNEEAQRMARMVRYVKKVYPYAKLAGTRFKEMNDQLAATKTRKERKKLIGTVEDEIKNKYGEELKKLTFSQGKILIKLLDRETGNSSYELVKEFRGSVMAFFYQGFAKIWGYNLKTKYDPNGEDKEIEMIVKMIEKGQL